jgi:methionine-R-sulfoxide reductase
MKFLLPTIGIIFLTGLVVFVGMFNKQNRAAVNDKTYQTVKLEVMGNTTYTDEEIQERIKKLDPLSYKVYVEEGTERAFENEYNNEKRDGIYVDKVTGEPLFSSTHKYNSGSGWPSFYKPITDEAVKYKTDTKLFIERTEVRSSKGHLGHVFNDGPQDKGGKRYCMNSAAMTFIPKEEMEQKGYGDYLYLFK